MTVDYNTFSKDFAESRKNMKWEEIEYFFSLLENKESLLDIGCGSGRLLESYQGYFDLLPTNYLGIDLSAWLLEEAQRSFPDMKFLEGNMLDVKSLTEGKVFQNIFLIASFHHLRTIDERVDMLQSLYDILPKGWKIYMTNWALDSSVNHDKYISSRLESSENKFSSWDYNIKFWEHDRFYHCFSLNEIDYLARDAGFIIRENKLFDSQKNIITILEK